MPAQLQLALFGAVPAILAMAYFDRLDAKRPEPRSTLRRVALAGGLSAIPVVLIGQLLQMIGPDGGATGTGTYVAALYMSFVIAAFPEEAAKLGAVFLFAWRRPEFDERMDGIVYGARAGLGFALVENVAYLLFMPESVGEYVAVFIGRAVLAVPGHATWGAMMGYFAARRRFDGRGPGVIGGYLLAVGLHGIYDTFVFATPVAIANGAWWLGLGVFGVPVVAYAAPALVIAGGAIAVRIMARRAIAADDAAEARGEPPAKTLIPGHPAYPGAWPPPYSPQQYPQQHYPQQQYPAQPYPAQPYPAGGQQQSPGAWPQEAAPVRSGATVVPTSGPSPGNTMIAPAPPQPPVRTGITIVSTTAPPTDDP